MWVAARRLGSAERRRVRDAAYGAGVAAWGLQGIPQLVEQGRVAAVGRAPSSVRERWRKKGAGAEFAAGAAKSQQNLQAARPAIAIAWGLHDQSAQRRRWNLPHALARGELPR